MLIWIDASAIRSLNAAKNVFVTQQDFESASIMRDAIKLLEEICVVYGETEDGK